VIAALSLTPLVATRSKAQLALSQTLSRPHDDSDGDNEAPYVPSGTVAGLGVTVNLHSLPLVVVNLHSLPLVVVNLFSVLNITIV
jgi:hypothetical protein